MHRWTSRYVQDLTVGENGIFQQLQSYLLTTTLYLADAVDGYSDSSNIPVMYNADQVSGPEMDGSWYADANVQVIFTAQRRQRNQLRKGYQFMQNPCAYDVVFCDTDRFPFNDEGFDDQSTKLENQLRSDLAAQGNDNVSVLRAQFTFPYFHHNAAIAAGVPWDLLEMQGDSKTWWLGASAWFENVHDVVNYNLLVLSLSLD